MSCEKHGQDAEDFCSCVRCGESVPVPEGTVCVLCADCCERDYALVPGNWINVCKDCGCTPLSGILRQAEIMAEEP